MKTPAEYLADAQHQQQDQEPNYCTLGGRIVGTTVAERAVALALADAERYRQHLVGAVLRAKP